MHTHFTKSQNEQSVMSSSLIRTRPPLEVGDQANLEHFRVQKGRFSVTNTDL